MSGVLFPPRLRGTRPLTFGQYQIVVVVAADVLKVCESTKEIMSHCDTNKMIHPIQYIHTLGVLSFGSFTALALSTYEKAKGGQKHIHKYSERNTFSRLAFLDASLIACLSAFCFLLCFIYFDDAWYHFNCSSQK